VTLDRDVRIDDVEQVTQAIKMIRCVSQVEHGPVADMAQRNARLVAYRKLRANVWKHLVGLEDNLNLACEDDES
ncbi:hypothetical protein LCGC14_2834340, partial [marine sediment metagenome]